MDKREYLSVSEAQKIPWSEYALFHKALHGLDVFNVRGEKMPKYILWEKYHDKPGDLVELKNRSHFMYTFQRSKIC